jgi:diaminohydroxyphosphoribosylaminopyrimidine deaminase/5-amino-6-(5-phosphoribosylamino)uracil reductase
MKLAIDLSRRGLGTTSPNPVVGCVIVKDGIIVGTGYHEFAGGPHAEIVALKAAGNKVQGADVYVTLEPCSFYGRTPPCVEALLSYGVKRVIVAVRDPHPKVSGRGIEILKKNGVEVVEGLLSREAAFVNRYYLTAMTKKRPYVTIKIAATLDGYIADRNGDSKWITSEAARDDVQELRRIHDAIIVGANTYIKDRPKLTYRGSSKKIPALKRFVAVSSRESLEKVLDLISEEDLFIVAPESLLESMELGNSQILLVAEKNGRVNLQSMLEKMHELEIRSLLVEGGAKLAGSFLEEGLYDELVLYLAPKLFARGKKLVELEKDYTVKNPFNLKLNSMQLIDDVLKLNLFNPEADFNVYWNN